MSLAWLVRSEVNRLARPGQTHAATVANRLLRSEGLAARGAMVLNRCDPGQGVELRYAVYGRGRYGRERYGR